MATKTRSLTEDLEQLFSVEELAAYLKFKPATIRAMLRRGELRGFKVGKEWRIPRTALADIAFGIWRDREDLADPAAAVARWREEDQLKPDGTRKTRDEYLKELIAWKDED